MASSTVFLPDPRRQQLPAILLWEKVSMSPSSCPGSKPNDVLAGFCKVCSHDERSFQTRTRLEPSLNSSSLYFATMEMFHRLYMLRKPILPPMKPGKKIIVFNLICDSNAEHMHQKPMTSKI